MKTIIHYYKFNLKEAAEAEAYRALSEKLRGIGLKLFDGISLDRDILKYYTEKIKPLDGQLIDLDTSYIFNNQWNTGPVATSEQGLRVFDWGEEIVTINRYLKMGMWLEQTDEMKYLRDHTYKCGYCGALHVDPSYDFCDKCLDSEYLKEGDLPLLELRPVSKEDEKREKPIPKALVVRYKEVQQIARKARLDKHKADKIQSMQQEKENLEHEHAAFTWLIENDLDFDNVIFYAHLKTFSFGWRTPYSKEQAESIRKVLETGFPGKFEIKTTQR